MGKYISIKHRHFAARGLFFVIAAALFAGCVPPADTNSTVTNANAPAITNTNTDANTSSPPTAANDASPLGNDGVPTAMKIASLSTTAGASSVVNRSPPFKRAEASSSFRCGS